MVTSIVGTWKPYAREAIADETPKRPLKENGFATLHIDSDGEGIASRRRLLKEDLHDLKWKTTLAKNGVVVYQVTIPYAEIMLIATVLFDEMEAVVVAPEMPGIYRMKIYFHRV